MIDIEYKHEVHEHIMRTTTLFGMKVRECVLMGCNHVESIEDDE